MIEVRELTKDYGTTVAIDRLSFSVQKGEVVGFLGPNGAGKTTTMKIITGFMAPSSGEVRVAGFDVFEHPIDVKKRIGYLPETPPVYGDMYVRDFLKFVAQLKGCSGKEIPKLVDKAVSKAGLQKVAHRIIGNLSKGFRQRVGIAQALVSEPEILILDEPTVGLDPIQMKEIRALINELKGEHTIVLSTHILPEVQMVCERIIIINNGKIVAEDTLEGLSNRMQGSGRLLIKVKNPSDSLVKEMRNLKGVKKVHRVKGNGSLEIDTEKIEDMPDRLASLVLQQKAGLVELRSLNIDLEQIFIQLTSDETTQGVRK